ncbi:uncharacterized PE-PGRS family protein PE_PGRS54-like [Impatiens glandulifera]|uniref:uncharacterized PE-PGRS family protein PE_PGRS54-like n=1 Tax=Impatiens glandulifera TaxID=253017 RepID=UPI001FB05B0C|nr:uncharacterized PE-PGRS family protein PE_PGRS54-like [Impatiens glandulifera]
MEEQSKKRRTDENSLSPYDARKILDPLSKEQLIEILQPAVFRHQDVLDAVRSVADIDSSNRKLVVRGLGPKTSTETLQNVFSFFGEVEESRVIKDYSNGRSKGHGFVTFKHIDCAMAALQEPIKKIDGRKTTTYHSVVRTNDVDVSLRKIFVGNIPLQMSADKLLTHFSAYGGIEFGPVGFDEQSGKHNGFAFFIYKTEEGARASLIDGIHTIDGHQLKCELAKNSKKSNNVPNSDGAQLPPSNKSLPDPNHGMGSCGYVGLNPSNNVPNSDGAQLPPSNISLPDPNHGMGSCGNAGLNPSNNVPNSDGAQLPPSNISLPDPNHGMGSCVNSANGGGSYGNQGPSSFGGDQQHAGAGPTGSVSSMYMEPPKPYGGYPIPNPNYGMGSCGNPGLNPSNNVPNSDGAQLPPSNISMPHSNHGMGSCVNSANGGGSYGNQGPSSFGGDQQHGGAGPTGFGSVSSMYMEPPKPYGGYPMPNPNYGMGSCGHAGLNPSNNVPNSDGAQLPPSNISMPDPNHGMGSCVNSANGGGSYGNQGPSSFGGTSGGCNFGSYGGGQQHGGAAPTGSVSSMNREPPNPYGGYPMPNPNNGMGSCGNAGLNPSNGGGYGNQGPSSFGGTSSGCNLGSYGGGQQHGGTGPTGYVSSMYMEPPKPYGGYSMPNPNSGMGSCGNAGLNSSNGGGYYGNQRPSSFGGTSGILGPYGGGQQYGGAGPTGFASSMYRDPPRPYGWNYGMSSFAPPLPPSGRYPY